MAMVEENIRRIAAGIAGGLRATAELDFRIIFPALEKDAGEAGFIADVAAELVGPGNVNRDGALVVRRDDGRRGRV